MSVLTARNVNYIPAPISVPNGINPSRNAPMPATPRVIPPSGLPTFSQPVKVSKGEKFATEFLNTQKKLQYQEAYRQNIHDYLNVRDTGAPQLVMKREVSNLAQINQAIQAAIPNEGIAPTPPPAPTRPAVPPSQRRSEPVHDVASINPLTGEMQTTSTQMLADQVAHSTSASRGTQTARPLMREMDTSTEVDRMVADSLSPNLNQIVHNNYYQTVHNNQYLQQQYNQNNNTQHHHLTNYSQVVQNTQNVQNVVNHTLQQQQVNNIINQQQNVMNNMQATQNNLNMLSLDADAIGIGQYLSPPAGDNRVVTRGTGTGTLLAIEDRPLGEPLIEEVEDVPGTSVVPRTTTVTRRPRQPRQRPTVRTREIQRYRAPPLRRSQRLLENASSGHLVRRR